MSTKTSLFVALLAFSLFGTGCFGGQQARVTSRSVSAVAAGGPAEVWVVMGETSTDVVQNGVVLNKDSYALFHCIPQGCKRVSELAGTQVSKR